MATASSLQEIIQNLNQGTSSSFKLTIPPQKKRRRKKIRGFVYLMDDQRDLKVGITKNIDNRKRNYLTENPRLRCHAYFQAKSLAQAKQIEAELISLTARYRTFGNEWCQRCDEVFRIWDSVRRKYNPESDIAAAEEHPPLVVAEEEPKKTEYSFSGKLLAALFWFFEKLLAALFGWWIAYCLFALFT